MAAPAQAFALYGGNHGGLQSDIAFLYFFWQLDLLGDVVYDLALDLHAKPQAWRAAGVGLVGTLEDLRLGNGTSRASPSTQQRSTVFGAVFGSGFTNVAQQLLMASAALADRKIDNPVALKEGFRAAALEFKDYLATLAGGPIQVYRADLLKFTDTIYGILQDAEIQKILGFANISKDYPYVNDVNGHEMVAEISKRVGSRAVTSAEVMNRQRLALAGAKAIDEVLGFNAAGGAAAQQIDDLAAHVYRWLLALQMMNGQSAVASSAASSPATTAVVPAYTALRR